MSKIAKLVLALVLISSLAVNLVPGQSYSRQNREFAGAAPSGRFPLGADDLGRDRLTRLLYATRISLLLSGAAAAVAILFAFLAGGIAGYCGGWVDSCVTSARSISCFPSRGSFCYWPYGRSCL